MTVTVVGDGQMGLVLSDALARKVPQGLTVRLWGPFEDEVRSLAETRCSPRLPDFQLDQRIEVTEDGEAALEGASILLNAIPTQFIRRVWEKLEPDVPHAAPLVCVSKGLEIESLLAPSEILEQVTGASRGFCALSGPTIARELAERQPATMVAASSDASLAERIQELFTVPWLRVYRHDDVRGVEIAGATKNVVALATGMADGLELGLNAKSALLARGLAEMARLGAAMGARVDTFFGVAGVGDLATTCFSPHSRNRTCGERLGRGERLEDILESTVSVVEGVPTTRAVTRLAQQHGVEMPITEAVHSILFDDLQPQEALRGLMERSSKAERIG